VPPRGWTPMRASATALLAGLLVWLPDTGVAAPDPAPAGATEPSPASDSDLASILAAFAAVPGLTARFREEKQIALLEAPLVSEGVLHFAPPDRLARRQESPEPSLIVLAGSTMWLQTETESQRIDLVSQPLVGAVVASFRALLAGDRAELDRIYAMDIARSDDGWRVGLTPRDEILRRAIERVEIRGRGITVESLRVAETSGDTTTLRFEDVDPARRFSPEEAAELFRVPLSRVP
jgi:hypothetical protein